MEPRILVLDIETQRAVVETFSIWKPFIGIDRVIVPARVLCFAAKWRGEDRMIFKSAWTDDDEDAYLRMMRAAFDLLSEAEYVTTFNGDNFDLQWLECEMGRLGLGRPTPYKSVDLFKTNKKKFRAGQMSLKLDWSARRWLKDRKVVHGIDGDLWHEIRHGTRARQRDAQKTMRAYNEHDTILTEKLFEAYLPWLNINLAMGNDDDLLHCTKCNSTNLKRDGVKFYNTLAGSYQLHRCKDCGSTSRGKRMQRQAELRPVA